MESNVGCMSNVNEPPFNLLTVQTTSACNLKCSYCYQNDESFKSPAKITFEIFKRTIDSLIEYQLSINSTEPISITFHGGEPLLLGHEFFSDVLSYIDKLDNTRLKDRFSLAVQTNLTLLDQEYCDIFKYYNVGISTSIDGPEWLHNKHRGSEVGNNHATVMKNVYLARENDLKVGAICIITADKLPYVQEIFDFFSEHKINFKTNPPFLHGQARKNQDIIGVSTQEYASFLKNLFDIWYTSKPTVMIENLFEMINIVLKGAGSGSCVNSNCSTKHITITPNGDCYTCGRTTGNPNFCFGNIMNINFSDIANTSTFRHINSRVPDKIDICSNCTFKYICFSGCMYEAYSLYGTIYSPDRNCDAFKTVYTHIHNKIKDDLLKIKGA